MRIRHWRQSRLTNTSTAWTLRSFFAVAGWLIVLTTATSQAQPVPANTAPAQISIWIKQLSSLKFAEREAASNQLKMAGLASISELVKAAQGSNPEVTARAIECLSFLYESPEVAISIAADEALEKLLKDGPPAAAQRTEQAFAFDLAPARRRNAIAAIQSLGGIIVPIMDYDEKLQRDAELSLQEPGSIQHAILGKNWQGNLASVKYLERLRPELRTIYVTSDAPLKDGELDLYRAALPQMVVEPRGGYLGISGTQFDPERCEVEKIAPNSPAKAAGLQVHDRLTHLNGIPIKGFLSLTTLLLQRKGGETVILDVLRNTGDRESKVEELEISVTLGEWGAPPKPPEKVPETPNKP